MLYVFGDSFTYGYTLPDRSKCWAENLGKKWDLEVINVAYPGGSNWRIGREIQNLNITSKDIVIIGWTISNRFEFGKNPHSDLFKNPEFIIEENKDKYPFANNENSDVQSFFDQIIDRVSDTRLQAFSEVAYNALYNEEWFDEMFRIMYWATRYYLEKRDIKWLMFDTWCSTVDSRWRKDLNHLNYKYCGKNNINNVLKKTYKGIHHESGYWNEKGHQKVSDLLLLEYSNIYG